jgi:hypothetical protein
MSTIYEASIGQGTQQVHDVDVGTATGGPVNQVTDFTVNAGTLDLLADLPLEEQNGQWIPATITETLPFTATGDPGIGTYTSSITAAGLITIVETGSWNFTVGSGNTTTTYAGTDLLQGTIDLSAVNSGGPATFIWHRVDNETITSQSFNQSDVETQDRTASLPVTLSPVTNAFIYVSPDQPTITAAHPNATFSVSLDHPLTYPVSVNYATEDGTAVAGTDYTAESGDLTFAAGQLHQTISVPILNNPNASGNPVFYVDLSNPSASGGAAQPFPSARLQRPSVRYRQRQLILVSPTISRRTPMGRRLKHRM